MTKEDGCAVMGDARGWHWNSSALIQSSGKFSAQCDRGFVRGRWPPGEVAIMGQSWGSYETESQPKNQHLQRQHQAGRRLLCCGNRWTVVWLERSQKVKHSKEQCFQMWLKSPKWQIIVMQTHNSCVSELEIFYDYVLVSFCCFDKTAWRKVDLVKSLFWLVVPEGQSTMMRVAWQQVVKARSWEILSLSTHRKQKE